MASQEINLLSNQTERRIAVSDKFRGVLKALFGIIGIEIVFSAVLIGWQLSLNKTIKKVEDQNKQTETKIDQYRDIESMMFTISSRVKMIKPLFKPENKKVSSILKLVSNLSSQGFQPKGDLKISGEDSLQIEGSVDDVYALDKIKTMMGEYQNQGYFQNYKVNSVLRNQGGQYQLTIILYLSKETAT